MPSLDDRPESRPPARCVEGGIYLDISCAYQGSVQIRLIHIVQTNTVSKIPKTTAKSLQKGMYSIPSGGNMRGGFADPG